MGYNREDIVFIVNANSGKKDSKSLVDKIFNIDNSFNVHVTKSVEEFEDFIKKNIDNFKVFIIAGGDGTINEMVKYLFNRTDKVLAIIPQGSGNGFARETGFKTKLNKLIDSAYKGETYLSDVIEINNKKFINAAGIGFDSCVAHHFAQREKRGLIGYFFTTLKCMRKFKNFDAKISFDGINLEDKFKMVTFANTRQFGNNALIAPKANPRSGKLDVVMIKPFPFYYYPIFVINMFTGRIKDSKYIIYRQIKSDLKIKSLFSKYHIDGDPIEFDKTTVLKIHKASLRVLRTNKTKI